MWGFITYWLKDGLYARPTFVGVHLSTSTMKKLTIHIQAPMASFSTGQRLTHRPTTARPSRSMVLGLIACAMGRERGADLSDLEKLTIELGASVSSPPAVDFQTVRGGVTYEGKPNRNIVTHRHFLQDYHSSLTITGDDALVDAVEQALRFPVWQLYVGRRAYVTSAPVVQGAAVVVI